MSDEPLLIVTRGEPDDVELAALVAAVLMVARRPIEPERSVPWNDPASVLRLPVRPGPGAWRHAA